MAKRKEQKKEFGKSTSNGEPTKQVKKPQVIGGSSLPEVGQGNEATVLEFTGKPDGLVEVLVLMPGKYEDFSVGQKLKIG